MMPFLARYLKCLPGFFMIAVWEASMPRQKKTLHPVAQDTVPDARPKITVIL
jgi:hypothetical protein